MITVRRANARHHERRGEDDTWLTFDAENPGISDASGFGWLENISERRLSPGWAGLCKSPHDAEIVTYVRDGSLAYDDGQGGSGVIQAGEFHCASVRRNDRRKESNPSPSAWAWVFQLSLHPEEADLEPRDEVRRFSAAERRDGLCMVASPDARKSTLTVRQDALVYAALLFAGQHVVHELKQGRCAWLHVVDGELTVGGVVLTTGDGGGFVEDRAVSLTAREPSEILLIELGAPLGETLISKE
jgi:redox-sensitive bicupin YhaK (pirin superfamily)